MYQEYTLETRARQHISSVCSTSSQGECARSVSLLSLYKPEIIWSLFGSPSQSQKGPAPIDARYDSVRAIYVSTLICASQANVHVGTGK